MRTTPTTTGEFVPDPTQAGMPDTCLAWHQAAENGTCQDMVDEEGYLTVEDLIDINVSASPTNIGVIDISP